MQWIFSAAVKAGNTRARLEPVTDLLVINVIRQNLRISGCRFAWTKIEFLYQRLGDGGAGERCGYDNGQYFQKNVSRHLQNIMSDT
jgi:hypothetical protein